MSKTETETLHTLIQELKKFCETLTEEEKKIAGFENFDFEKYEEQQVVFGVKQMTKHVQDMIPGIKDDLAKHQKKLAILAKDLSCPKLISRYISLHELKKVYVRARLFSDSERRTDNQLIETIADIANEFEGGKLDEDEKYEYVEILNKLDIFLTEMEQTN